MLHCYELSFNHPITGVEMNLRSRLPEDFLNTLKNIGLSEEIYKLYI